MKVVFYKAKHFWKEGKNATWVKSEKFGIDIFSNLKQQYENIKYSKINYIELESTTTFLFYETKKDFYNRPVTEITALQSAKKIKNHQMVYKILSDKIPNVFDDTLEYKVEIDSSLIVKPNLKLYIGGLIVILLVGAYFLLTKESMQLQKNNHKEIVIQEKIKTNEFKKKEKIWRWGKFCVEYDNVKSPGKCYQSFIQKKCEAKEKFNESNSEFIKKDATCWDLKEDGISDIIQGDKSLKEKGFRRSELDFFKGDELNEKRKIRTITHPKAPIKKVDTSKFITAWNKVIVKIKYDNTHLKINFDKYKLENLPQSEIKTYLTIDKNRYTSLKKKLATSKYAFKYIPLIDWVEQKNKIKYIKPDKDMDSYELMEYVAKIVNPGKSFSNNTINRVVQLNEFCYFFEKNREGFYRKGYSKNMENCEKIDKLLVVDEIEFRLK